MELDEVLQVLEESATEHTKKNYLSRGVREPLFGVPTGAMKPLKKRIGVDQALADALWDTGNYDAMYFAGMIADVDAMSAGDFDRWIDRAYCRMLSDFVVAVTLAESDLAQPVALGWIRSGDEARASAGWACYEWLLAWRPDTFFDTDEVSALLDLAGATIQTAPDRVKPAIRNFVVAVGVSYMPLHDHAVRTAESIGSVAITSDGERRVLGSVAEPIRLAEAKGRLGFKRRAVRC